MKFYKEFNIKKLTLLPSITFEIIEPETIGEFLFSGQFRIVFNWLNFEVGVYKELT